MHTAVLITIGERVIIPNNFEAEVNASPQVSLGHAEIKLHQFMT